jgi:hypothetical protein
MPPIARRAARRVSSGVGQRRFRRSAVRGQAAVLPLVPLRSGGKGSATVAELYKATVRACRFRPPSAGQLARSPWRGAPNWQTSFYGVRPADGCERVEPGPEFRLPGLPLSSNQAFLLQLVQDRVRRPSAYVENIAGNLTQTLGSPNLPTSQFDDQSSDLVRLHGRLMQYAAQSRGRAIRPIKHYGVSRARSLASFAYFPARAATIALSAFGTLAIMLAAMGNLWYGRIRDQSP